MKTYSLIFNSVTSSFSSVTPAKAGAQLVTRTAAKSRIPACAGMTVVGASYSTSNNSVFP